MAIIRFVDQCFCLWGAALHCTTTAYFFSMKNRTDFYICNAQHFRSFNTFRPSCVHILNSQVVRDNVVVRPRGYSQKNCWGVYGPLPKTPPYLRPTSIIFPTLFVTWPNNLYPYKRCLLNQYPVSDLSYNEKVTSPNKNTPSKTRVQKPHPIWDQNGRNQYTIDHFHCHTIKEQFIKPSGGNATKLWCYRR